MGLGQYIRNRFGLWKGNEELLRSCSEHAEKVGRPRLGQHPDDASATIIDALWERLSVG